MRLRPNLRLASFALLCCASAFAEHPEDLPTRALKVLQQNCLTCHGGAKASGLDMRTREGLIEGGEHGPAVVPHEPEKSRLWRMASHELKPAMPPGKKLEQADLDLVKEWIEAGAHFPKGADAAPVKDAGLQTIPERPITVEERNYWAFKSPVKRTPPAKGNAIDAYLRASLSKKGIKPAPRADRRTLIRRAYLDLVGLPPTPAQVDEFVHDKSPQAWQKLVDRLLASPHYGERWARHWLDVVRYADSDGYEFDRDRADMWRYRDYVVRAFNSDKPYDVFLKEQIAGDEIDPTSADAMIATGYLRLGPNDTAGGDSERARQELLDDVVSTTTLAFTGLTVGCARCHDHKFDPIPQKDYYKLQAVFASIKPIRHPLVAPEQVKAYDDEVKRINGEISRLRQEQEKLQQPYHRKLVEEAVSKLPEYLQIAWRTQPDQRSEGQRLNVRQIERALRSDASSKRITQAQVLALMPEDLQAKNKELAEQIAILERSKPKEYEAALAVSDAGRSATPAFFLHRGSLGAKGPAVEPGILAVVSEKQEAFPSAPDTAKTTWRRKALAEWLASPGNPLTSRVMVNRIWQHHFGEGLVRTPSNFGKLGEAPSHPELLDWLAVEFIDSGWSIKAMHRLMMNSDTYQMASDDQPAGLEADPENRLWWRMPRARLEAEAIRDQILAVSGALDKTMGGPCVFPHIAPELIQSSTQRNWPGKPDSDPSTWRRSLYVFSKRSIRYPMFETFDQPNLVNSCDRRNRSTIAPQALLMMNNSFMLLQAEKFAERLQKEAGPSADKQVDLAFQLAFARSPRPEEKSASLEYLKGEGNRLSQFCHALFSANEFVYRP